MEHYEKKISFLGENIQTIRKHRGMKQQELADKIGINMQSLSKIEYSPGARFSNNEVTNTMLLAAANSE